MQRATKSKAATAGRARGAASRLLVMLATSIGYGLLWAVDRFHDRAERRRHGSTRDRS